MPQDSRVRFDPVVDDELIRHALAEDVGRGDITTEATIPADARARATLVARAEGVIAGLPVSLRVFYLLDPQIAIETLVHDGEHVSRGTVLARLSGNARAILTAERTALNFLGRLSGTATLASACARAVAGTGAVIVDTRKTTPGLRALEKYAVRMGGASNHRAGLDDGILIKDNHIAIAGSVRLAVQRARAHAPHLIKIEVECDTPEQVREAVEAEADAILLDNMSAAMMREQVNWIHARAPRTLIEASGGIGPDPERLAEVAATGVDIISLGALTHSAPNFDVALDFEAGA